MSSSSSTSSEDSLEMNLNRLNTKHILLVHERLRIKNDTDVQVHILHAIENDLFNMRVLQARLQETINQSNDSQLIVKHKQLCERIQNKQNEQHQLSIHINNLYESEFNITQEIQNILITIDNLEGHMNVDDL